MLKKRIIALLLIKDGYIVRSQKFNFHQKIGKIQYQLERYLDWELDELIILDISNTPGGDCYKILSDIVSLTTMPLTYGGNIRNLKQIEACLQSGCEKVLLNTVLFETPSLITTAAMNFGRQAIVAGIDLKKSNISYKIYSHHGEQEQPLLPEDWIYQLIELGAGEIFLNFIDKDGMGTGFDILGINKYICDQTTPITVGGGAGSAQDIINVFEQTNAHAVVVGNLLLFTEMSYISLKHKLNFLEYIRPAIL